LYQLVGRDLLFDWLAQEPNPQRRQAVLDRLAALARRPTADAQRLPGVRAPVYIAVVATEPLVIIEFLVAEEFRTVRLLDIRAPR